jgi:Ser/Thr protein kinase RdoA (MazF antagonist)
MFTLEQPIAYGRTAEIFPWEDGQVLKLFHDWVPRSWAEQEAAVTRAVYAAGLPAPWCGDVVEIDGRYGVVFEKILGATQLQMFNQEPRKLFSLISVLAQIHTQLHATRNLDLPSQYDSIKKSIWDAPSITDGQRKVLLAELDQMPQDDRVCHNDFHPDNLMMTPRGPIIIDWMTAKRGNPMADVARTVLIIDNGAPVDDIPRRRMLVLARRIAGWWYQKQYARYGDFDANQFKRWLPIMAAARLNEKIPGELEWLLKLIESGFENVESSANRTVQSK